VRRRARYGNYSRRARLIAAGIDLAALPAAPLLRLLSPRGMAPSPPRSILVVRLDHIGDMLMTTPALRALRLTFPAARLDVLAAPSGQTALVGNPDVDRILTGIAPWYDPCRGELPAPAEVLRLSARLRREAYDWAFDMRGDPRVVLLYLLPAARRRFGFSGLGLARLLTDTIPYDRRRPPRDLALDLAVLAGARPAGLRPVYTLDPAARRRAAAILGEAGVGPDQEFAVVAPGSNRPNARWGGARFARVCDRLQAAGLKIVLSGRAEDAAVTGEVAALARRPVADLTGRLDLRHLAAALERAVLLLANDSGASHLAAAVDCATVAVFGPGDPALFFPYQDGRRFVALAAAIDHPRPCFDSGCVSDHGFSLIAPEEVATLCLRVVEEARRARRAIG